MSRLGFPVLLVVVLLTANILAGCTGAAEGTAEWHLEQGNKLIDQGLYNKAIEEYTEAIRLNPEYALAYNNRSYSYENLGQFVRASEDYDEAIRLNPEFAVAYNNRALTYK